MKYPKTSFRDWTKRFRTERECLEAVARVRWSEGFRCPRCGHDKAFVLKRHCIRQRASCAFPGVPEGGHPVRETPDCLLLATTQIFCVFVKKKCDVFVSFCFVTLSRSAMEVEGFGNISLSFGAWDSKEGSDDETTSSCITTTEDFGSLCCHRCRSV